MAALTRLQIRRTAVIHKVQRIAKVAATVIDDTSQLLSLEVRIESLDDLVAEFNDVQNQIEAQMQTKEGTTLLEDQMAIREQFDDDIYSIKAIYRSLTRPPPAVSNTSQQPTKSTNVYLPKLKLPTFAGDYLMWSNFSDLFLTLIDQNSSLSSIEKFQYLKLSLSGEPEQLLKNILVNATNYHIAWDTLKNRYDNKRIIVDQHLDKLLNLPVIVKPTFIVLKDFVNIINENVSALTTLDLPVASWSYLLVAIIIRKLDFDTRNRWEATLKRNLLPKFTDLIAFLDHLAASREWQVVEEKSTPTSRPSNSKASSSTASNIVLRKPSYQSTFLSQTEPSTLCVICNASHSIYTCKGFKKKSPNERFEIAKQYRLCINCLHPGHRVTRCPSSNRCAQCKAQHHTMLHFGPRMADTSGLSSSKEIVMPIIPTDHGKVLLTGSTHIYSTVILATAVVSVQDSIGTWQSVRVLLDCASQASYMSESCHQRLGLKRRRCQTPIYALGDIELESAKGTTTCNLKPLEKSIPSFGVTAIIVSRISGNMPSSPFETASFSHLAELQLADPGFNTPGRVDMLLGADLFPHVLLGGRVMGDAGSPAAIETIFGWVIMGEIYSSKPAPPRTYHLTNNSIDSILKRFWEVEEISLPNEPQTSDDARCEFIFQTTSTRSDSGRYTVSLPFIDPTPRLGNSYKVALQCYFSLRRRLAANPALEADYGSFMRDYVDSGHMSLVSHSKSHESLAYFIPHHCVLKPGSTSTKLRVVFNASKKTSLDNSLNDILLTGPPLQQDLSAILVRFRFHAYVMTADIKQMYRQILIHPHHRPFQQILWSFDSNQPPDVYKLNTITYGLSCAPYLALRTLQQLASDDGHLFPSATIALRRDTYVDDVITGCNSLQDAIKLQHELSLLFAAGNFDLRKWTSNHPLILSSVPSSHQQQPEVSVDLDLTNESTIKVLGLHWNPSADILSYKIQTEQRKCSKRIILSEIAKIFDPLGLLTPLTMAAKRILQKLWAISLDWDDIPPIDIVNRWNQIHGQLDLLVEIKVPRFITKSDAIMDLLGFCDASEAGYAAAIYIRSTCSDCIPRIALLCAKSRVAPLKRLSLPRLELCAALLLARLMKFVREALHLNIESLYAWSDSTVALAWIQQSPHRWKTFVSNRVTEIQTVISPNQWHHIRSADNPADCGSRGILPRELIHHPLWWSGPSWLTQPPDTWPISSSHMNEAARDKVRHEESILTLVSLVDPHTIPLFDLLNKYSSLFRLLRITAYCLRFYNRCKTPAKTTPPFLTAKEISHALHTWIRNVQSESFAGDISLIIKNLPCSRPLQKLNPFIDSSGLLRVGGRIRNSLLSYEKKHPLLLPQDSRLTELIIRHYHLLHLHPGAQTLLAILAQKFWILSARNVVRKQLGNCQRCFRCNPSAPTPLMGNLPANRVSQLKPFQIVGVDYGGPFTITFNRNRGARSQKAYLCLFVCFATKALHLELASSLSTEAFLAAFRRFIARRGRCSQIYSDCGTNFIGARRHLAELYALTASISYNEDVSSALVKEGIEWHFNPPSAPHFGGLWEAGIKSVKVHLRKVVGDQVLTYEEFYTVLTQIEALLNSRPLCALSSDPNDLQALTPGHFLVQEPLVCLPDPDLSDVTVNRLTRWQLLQRLHQDFWKRWHAEYLNTLQQRQKWTKPQTPLIEGNLVLIKDDLAPPIRWRLGRVIETVAGPDGIIRVATVRTNFGDVQRPAVKLCQLPNQ